MSLQQRIDTLAAFGTVLLHRGHGLEQLMGEIEIHNRWFTRHNQENALDAIGNYFLNADKLNTWVSRYSFGKSAPKTIGLILAGNIPFTGMHDILSVLISGNTALIKQSSKDALFFPWMRNTLNALSPVFQDKMVFNEQLKGFDAVITTGSNNAGKYFEYYFGKYPHIIRKNRTSAAVISDGDSDEALHALGKDVFMYYGLGCRNVSKLFLPRGFEPERLFRIWEDYRPVMDNDKYKNNYDYNSALLILNRTPYLNNGCILLAENPSIASRIAMLYYEFYEGKADLEATLRSRQDEIQCVVTKPGWLDLPTIPFGKTQDPGLEDYPDGVDVMSFLLEL